MDVKELQAFHDMARKLFKEDDPQLLAAKKRLGKARDAANGKNLLQSASVL